MNAFALSCIITAALTIILGLIVLLKNPKNQINREWFAVSVAIFLWTIGLFGSVIVPDKHWALFWQRLLYFGTTLIPLFFFHYTVSFLNIKRTKSNFLFAGYFIAFIFLLFIPTHYFIVTIGNRTSFGYWPVKTGPLYIPFLLYFISYVSYSIVLLRRSYSRYSGTRKRQVEFIYYAALIGFIGGSTNFLLDFNLNVYPFGNFFVSFYVIIIFYAILKHHLMNIRVIATELFTFLIIAMLFLNIFSFQSLTELVTNIAIFFGTLIFGILLVRSVLKEVKTREQIQKIARKLEEANKRLRQIDKVKSEFISIASHQLRTPLSIIKGYSSMALEGDYGKFTPEQKQIMNKILSSTERLIGLVEDLLNISRLEQGRIGFEFKKKSLVKLLKNIIEEIKPKAKEKKLKLIFKTPKGRLPQVMIDEEKIRQVFLNLLDNSIKYTLKGRVEVSIFRRKDYEIVRIKDTGVGMTQEELSSLFKRFIRGRRVTALYTEGVGLGLYFARNVVSSHKGKIWARSAGPGQGSEFFVQLPIRRK